MLSVPQNGGPRPIDIPAPRLPVAAYIEITELPANGTVRLADGITAVAPGQTLSCVQLNELTFTPAADACGKISILQYRTGGPAETAVTGGVLLVVGPDAPPIDMPTDAPSTETNIVAPLAVALLLDAALSSLNSAAAASPVSPNDATQLDATVPNGAYANLTDVPASDRASAVPPSNSTKARALNAGNRDSTIPDANGHANDDPPRHRIGSSTPPLAYTPSSTTVFRGGTDPAGQGALGIVPISPPAVKPDALLAGGTGFFFAATAFAATAQLGIGGTLAMPQVAGQRSGPASGTITTESDVTLVFGNPGGSPMITFTESLFSPNSVPSNVTVDDPNAVELGVRFIASVDGMITGLRFYKGPENSGPHVADLWSSNGTLLATATFSNETASGWQQVNFSSPVSITAGTTYIASYHTDGDYSADGGYFTNPITSGDLTAPGSGNGVYAYGSTSSFPTNTFNATNYWVDVVYTKSNQQLVANNDSGFAVNENGSTTISASALLANDTDSNGLSLSVTGVSNPTNGTVSYNSATQSVTFTPTAGYAGPATFTYSAADSSGAHASATVSLTVNDPNPVSLFSPTSTPAIVTVNDPNSVELGFKFQASTDGEIIGLRFYKGPDNTGPHVADLWSSSGTLLATATFTNETASGWQQVSFSNPVAITAGTAYVASYHTGGDYSADPGLFATAQSNGPLTAPASSNSGGNGVYAYGSSSLFPTSSFNSTSYGVDVVFKAQLAA
ncbi:DUF4082 domain-containing protein [Bradyrhizobium sp. dw_411]|uniref:DUF4082 domain-containing protein n=1 Tax=Bradyrhizobium sp. dw_411 TaxID=2720082 RepID=UPI0031FE4E45